MTARFSCLLLATGLVSTSLAQIGINVERYTKISATEIKFEAGSMGNDCSYQPNPIYTSITSVGPETLQELQPIDGRFVLKELDWLAMEQWGLVPAGWVRSIQTYRFEFLDYVIVGIAGSACDPNAAPTEKPNLAPYQPDGWSSELVVTTRPGTQAAAAEIRDDQWVFLHWSVANFADAANAGDPFTVRILLDGEKLYDQVISGLEAGYYRAREDYPVNHRLSAGMHFLEMLVDVNNSIAESNENDNVYSMNVWVQASNPLRITSQPQSIAVDWGASVTFQAAASGIDPITYQWRKDTVPLEGATEGTLVLPAVKSTDGGDYDVVVSNPTGSVISNVATLTVRLPDLPHGTPVTWLEQYDPTEDPVAAEVADRDGDGHPAWMEYVAGTIPTDAASVLRLKCRVDAAAEPSLTFPTAAGRAYSVQVSEDGRSWASLGDEVIGDGTEATWIDPRPLQGRSASLFRLTVRFHQLLLAP